MQLSRIGINLVPKHDLQPNELVARALEKMEQFALLGLVRLLGKSVPAKREG